MWIEGKFKQQNVFIVNKRVKTEKELKSTHSSRFNDTVLDWKKRSSVSISLQRFSFMLIGIYRLSDDDARKKTKNKDLMFSNNWYEKLLQHDGEDNNYCLKGNCPLHSDECLRTLSFLPWGQQDWNVTGKNWNVMEQDLNVMEKNWNVMELM